MRNPQFGAWASDDDPGDVQGAWIDIGVDDAPPDPLDAFRQMGAGARAAVLAALPDDATRALVQHLAADGTPRAWAADHGLSIAKAVTACRQAEAVLTQTFARVPYIGVSYPDQQLLRALATH